MILESFARPKARGFSVPSDDVLLNVPGRMIGVFDGASDALDRRIGGGPIGCLAAAAAASAARAGICCVRARIGKHSKTLKRARSGLITDVREGGGMVRDGRRLCIKENRTRQIAEAGCMKKAGLDATDIRILSAVQTHGQISKTRLAEIVHLSPTPCWARLTRLKTAGFIRGFHADIALDRVVDFTQVVVTVSLAHHKKQDFERFEAVVMELDEVTLCVATGGGTDYVLHVYTRSLALFQELMEGLLSAELGIERYMTYIVTRRIKSRQPNVAKLLGSDAK